ncbi:MAG TPA: 2-hydroxyacid dehydrogenase [Ktedonobacteraceae bacterium]|nr:2-hydroxyacid dehydrogenase [Ktedonobacteraceae bacterium]
MPGILLVDPVPAPLAERLRLLFPPAAPINMVASYSEEQLIRYALETEILLVIHRKVDAHLLSLLPRVRFIQRVGVGYDNLDLGALQAAGIVAAYTPGANAVPVAEHTILLMLALLKRFVAAESAARQGNWPTAELIQAGLGDLANATVGLVGFGNIGRAVAQRLAPFGTQLVYTARHAVDPAIEQQFGARYVSLDDLLASSKFVSLHLPLTATSRGLIGEAELAKMQQGAFLINTSRGEILDEMALHRALVSGKLGGAALDVLSSDPPASNPFADMPQVIVTPHIAGASRAGVERGVQMAIANVARFMRGESLLDLIPMPSAS